MLQNRRLKTVTVREFARLTSSELPTSTLDRAQVSATAFDWLCELAARTHGQTGARLLHLESKHWLQLDNFVGVVESPCGQRIEILPKHVHDTGDEAVAKARSLLRRMLTVALDLPSRDAEEAAIQRFNHSLTEWVMHRFLRALDVLVKRGLRSDYVRMEEQQPFLRGQLDVARQMRTPPGRAHLFAIRHDIFSIDRAENRLLKAALLRTGQLAHSTDNWRLAHTLLSLLADVPASSDVAADFRAWRKDRLMAHYEPVRPWCELVLGEQMPLALAGATRGVSLLFPMEKLFERFVGRAIRASLPPGYKLVEQARREFLCTHEGVRFFQLRPDFLIQGHGRTWILDAKWKILDMDLRSAHYKIKQSDFYQLHAYGHRYLSGAGEMALIYPQTQGFNKILGPFQFNKALSVNAVPFDLDLCSMPQQTWMRAWE